MASGQKAQSQSTQHPTLGPGEAILDDRNRSLGNIFLGPALVCLGLLGMLWGSGDLASGSDLLGFAYFGGGVVLVLYGARMTMLAAVQLRSRVALVIARDGFEVTGGNGPVRWDEVKTISDPASPPGEPRILRVQLLDPMEYVERHRVGSVGRYLLRVHEGDLFLGRDMAMPLPDVQALMRKRLAEFRTPHPAAWGEAMAARPVSARPGPKRRPARKR